MPASSIARLPIGRVLRDAAHTYRHQFFRVVGIAVLIYVPAEVLNIVIRDVNDDATGVAGGDVALYFVLTVVSTIVTTLGASFYAGLVDHTVHAVRTGAPPPPVGHVARHLPYLRMVGLSILVGLIVLVGLVLLVVPGFIAFTMLSIAGPLLVLERRGVLATVRRSVVLTKPQFWRVAALVVIPALAEETVVEAIVKVAGHSLVADVVVHGMVAAMLFAFVMLLEVYTAHWLVDNAGPREATVA